MSRRRLPASLVTILLAVGGGATQEEWDRFWSDPNDKGSQPDASPRTLPKSKSLQGAIGPLVTIEGARLTSVRGYGLVVDLVDTGGGGRDAPKEIKDYLVKEVRRQQEVGMPGMPAEQLLNSPDSAVVEVTGLIPSAAKKGDRFDVVVRAMGSQSKSLVGGRLVLCNLKLFAETPTGVIEGKTLATATGPLFVSIFDKKGEATSRVDLRTGFVLGGGLVKEPRRIRLVLNDPRYSTAQQIVNRLNGRYTPLEPIADAKSPSFVELTIPEAQRHRKRLFLEQVLHTTLNDNPALLERRAADLARELDDPDAPHESIGLAWEAIGKAVLPVVREAYSHPSPAARYYAGRTGLRLGDNGGMEVVARCARDPDSRFRMQAIDELGFAVNVYGAGEHLRQVLDDPDPAARIRSYRALRRRSHPAIESTILDQDNLILDVVDSGGPFLIYVQRLEQPRIAVFGRQMACKPPLMFPGERNDGRRLLTQLSADVDDTTVTVVYKGKRTGQQSPPLAAPTNVGALVKFLGDAARVDDGGEVEGLAVPYSEIVDILHTLCRMNCIPAEFVVESLEEGEEAGVEQPRERKESEF